MCYEDRLKTLQIQNKANYERLERRKQKKGIWYQENKKSVLERQKSNRDKINELARIRYAKKKEAINAQRKYNRFLNKIKEQYKNVDAYELYRNWQAN